MRRLLGSTLVVGVAIAMAPPANAQTPDSALARARAAYDATEFEDAVRLLRDLRSSLAPEGSADIRRDANLYLASAQLALGQTDSARARLADVVRADAFYRIDTLLFNPTLASAFATARSTTTAVRIAIPRDTTLRPDTDRLPVLVGVGRDGDVSLQLISDSGSVLDSTVASVPIATFDTVAVGLALTDSLALAPGRYRLVATAASSSGDTAEWSVGFRVERLGVDTVTSPAPLAVDQFLSETRKSGPVLSSFLKGALFGAAVAAPALVFSSSDLTSPDMAGSMAVGGAITVAGIVGVFAGRGDLPVPENIKHNQDLRSDWESRRASVAAENEYARRMAPLRIRREVTP